MTFEEAFLRLNGREPTGEEKRDALMIQDVVRGADLDPVLLVFLALGKYETLYRQGVQRITTAVEEAALQAAAIGERVGRERAEQAAVEGMRRKLAALAAGDAQPATPEERARQLTPWMVFSIVITSCILFAIAIGRIDGAAAAHGHLDPSRWLPFWGWALGGAALAEALHLVIRILRSRLGGEQARVRATAPGGTVCRRST